MNNVAIRLMRLLTTDALLLLCVAFGFCPSSRLLVEADADTVKPLNDDRCVAQLGTPMTIEVAGQRYSAKVHKVTDDTTAIVKRYMILYEPSDGYESSFLWDNLAEILAHTTNKFQSMKSAGQFIVGGSTKIGIKCLESVPEDISHMCTICPPTCTVNVNKFQ
eukprot:GHVS01108357.1.p1 GENE.GHVS01108357.1~~GHVS01108357.1.p1  ORF type:complete len:163 (+),score=14.60 GHVS01108357.1:136-624(+)